MDRKTATTHLSEAAWIVTIRHFGGVKLAEAAKDRDSFHNLFRAQFETLAHIEALERLLIDRKIIAKSDLDQEFVTAAQSIIKRMGKKYPQFETTGRGLKAK